MAPHLREDPGFLAGDYDTSILDSVNRAAPEDIEELAALALPRRNVSSLVFARDRAAPHFEEFLTEGNIKWDLGRGRPTLHPHGVAGA